MKQTALARFVHGISEDRLATPMCHDSKRIRRGLGWIVGVCVDFLPTWRLGRCLGVSEDEVHGTESTTTLVTGASRRERQVRLMIYKWSSKDEQRGKGNVRSFLEALRSGGELDLLLQICRSKQLLLCMSNSLSA